MNTIRKETADGLIREMHEALDDGIDLDAWCAANGARISEAIASDVSAPKPIDRIFVSAPWEDVRLVEALHNLIIAVGLVPTSTIWTSAARAAYGEGLEGKPPPNVPSDVRLARVMVHDIREAIRSSDALIACARHGAGGEMFAEIEHARTLGKIILWTGERVTLSTFASGVIRLPSAPAAVYWCRAYGAAKRRAIEARAGATP